jgi:hypothetical protein
MNVVITKLSVVEALSQPSVITGVALSMTLYLTFFFGALKTKVATTDKQISWLLTFMSSGGLTVASIPRFYYFWKSGWNIQSFQVDHTLDTLVLCYFVSYLILDLCLGSIYYKRQINILTGWIHHSVYTFITVYFLRYRLGGFFTTASILEMPTLIMALGSLRSRFRSDYLFAATFFAFRLVFHAFMIKTLKQNHHIRSLWIVAASIFPLHLFWFHGTCRKFYLDPAGRTNQRFASAFSNSTPFFFFGHQVSSDSRCESIEFIWKRELLESKRSSRSSPSCQIYPLQHLHRQPLQLAAEKSVDCASFSLILNAFPLAH